MMNSINEKVYKIGVPDNKSMLPGDLRRSPDESYHNKETLVFIDEAFLSKLSKHLGEGKYIKFDKILFSERLAHREGLFCKQIFYYLAPPFQSEPPTKEEEKKKEGHDKFVQKLRNSGLIVREGRCQRLRVDGKFEYHQKGVDVLLAMDLTSVPTLYPDVRKIILVSSDSDFVPVINYLRKLGIKTILYTYYEKNRNAPFSRSNHLIKSVKKYVILNKEILEKSLLIDKEVKNEKDK